MIEVLLGSGDDNASRFSIESESEATVEFEKPGVSTYGCDGRHFVGTVVVDPQFFHGKYYKIKREACPIFWNNLSIKWIIKGNPQRT